MKRPKAALFTLDEESRAAILLIRGHYGLASDAAAVRLALRETARPLGRGPGNRKGAAR